MAHEDAQKDGDQGPISGREDSAVSVGDIDAIRDLLALVLSSVPAASVIQGWSEQVRERVVGWASAVHLDASDNPVDIPPAPEKLLRWAARSGTVDIPFRNGRSAADASEVILLTDISAAALSEFLGAAIARPPGPQIIALWRQPVRRAAARWASAVDRYEKAILVNDPRAEGIVIPPAPHSLRRWAMHFKETLPFPAGRGTRKLDATPTTKPGGRLEEPAKGPAPIQPTKPGIVDVTITGRKFESQPADTAETKGNDDGSGKDDEMVSVRPPAREATSGVQAVSRPGDAHLRDDEAQRGADGGSPEAPRVEGRGGAGEVGRLNDTEEPLAPTLLEEVGRFLEAAGPCASIPDNGTEAKYCDVPWCVYCRLSRAAQHFERLKFVGDDGVTALSMLENFIHDSVGETMFTSVAFWQRACARLRRDEKRLQKLAEIEEAETLLKAEYTDAHIWGTGTGFSYGPAGSSEVAGHFSTLRELVKALPKGWRFSFDAILTASDDALQEMKSELDQLRPRSETLAEIEEAEARLKADYQLRGDPAAEYDNETSFWAKQAKAACKDTARLMNVLGTVRKLIDAGETSRAVALLQGYPAGGPVPGKVWEAARALDLELTTGGWVHGHHLVKIAERLQDLEKCAVAVAHIQKDAPEEEEKLHAQTLVHEFTETPEGENTGGISCALGLGIQWHNPKLAAAGGGNPPNGASVETVIRAALARLEWLNERRPCKDNALAIWHLNTALEQLERRRKRLAAEKEGGSDE